MDRTKIDNLIVYLMAIKGCAKDLHYNCEGANFYGNHEFADKFIKNIDEYVDLLKEVCLLGHGFKPLSSRKYYDLSKYATPENVEDFTIIRLVMINCLEHIETIEDITKGDENVIGSIAQDIQNNVGLLNIMYGDTRDGLR